MSDDEVSREICSTFGAPMGSFEDSDCLFPFEFLRSSGQGSCTLCIPSVSQTFT